MAILISTFLAGLATLFLALQSFEPARLRTKAGSIKDRTSVKSRLLEIGKSTEADYAEFRIRQALGSIATFLVTQVSLIAAGKSLFTSTLISVIVLALSYLYSERDLNKKVKEFRDGVEAEFPAVIEMLSLALSAGETPLAAMKRVSINANGPLALEFSQVLSRIEGGTPFHISLDQMGRGTHSVMVRRFVDAIIIAMLRGAPVIDVLQRHAQEAREAQRNRVLSAASKAEVSMMIPIVFLILPISILFALWPSLTNLNQFVG